MKDKIKKVDIKEGEVKTLKFGKKLKAFERFEQNVEFTENRQIYFEVTKGTPKAIVAFLDDEGKEIVTKVIPKIAFIKPFTHKCKILVINDSEIEHEIAFKVVLNVKIYE